MPVSRPAFPWLSWHLEEDVIIPGLSTFLNACNDTLNPRRQSRGPRINKLQNSNPQVENCLNKQNIK